MNQTTTVIKSERKQQILTLASDLLRTRGFEGFSYQDLSQELGIRKASIHHHFAKKEDLGLALCNWTKTWLEQGLNHFDKHGSSQWNKLERYIAAAKKHVLDEQKICPLSSLHGDMSLLPVSMVKAIKALDEIELNWVSRVLTEGLESGEFKFEGEARPLAAIFVFSSKGALHYARLHDQTLLSGMMTQFERWLRHAT